MDFVQQYDNNKPVAQTSTVTDMMVSRQAQEVQAAMVIAKKFPRDEIVAFDKIMRACQRKGLAEQAEYVYPRGGNKINGPSIRLAEAIAQNWGNIDYGIIELEQKDGASEMMAYAWDLESNTRVTKVFAVEHKRDTKKGSYKLEDSRDIYEATANFGARRVRACILGVVPGDVVDAAVSKCRETLKGSYKEPLEDRMRKMVAAFEEEFMISKEQIEEYLGYKLDNCNENDYGRMRGVFRSLRDGMSTVDKFFKIRKTTEVEDPFAKKEESHQKDKEGKAEGDDKE